MNYHVHVRLHVQVYSRVLEQISKQVGNLQLTTVSQPGQMNIEKSLHFLLPCSFLLILARFEIKEFVKNADSDTIRSFCLLFTRLPLRADANLMGLATASSFVKQFIDDIQSLDIYRYVYFHCEIIINLITDQLIFFKFA